MGARSHGWSAPAALAATLLVLGLATPASAAVRTVTKTADSDDNVCDADCSVREALFAAVDGADTISIPQPGAYQVTIGELTVGKTVAIQGAGARSVSLVGDANNRVVQLNVAGKTLTISGLTITGGTITTSAGFGGGIRVSAGTLLLSDVAVIGNRSSTANNSIGGGISVGSGATATLTRALVASNRATSTVAGGIMFGGGIDSDGTLTLVDSTVSGNSAEDDVSLASHGGGISANTGTTTLIASTVAGNSATGNGDGGNLYVQNAGVTINLRSTVVTGGSAATAANCRAAASGAFVSQGSNLESTTPSQCGLGAGELVGVDPLLTALGDHGGPTDTHSLAGPSPVVDAGGACGQATDQRGLPRSGPCDVGAFENQPPVAVATAASPVAPGAQVAFDASASSDPDRDPLALAWTFDDGATAAGAIVSRSFAVAGAHTGTVAASDPAGRTASATAAVQVIAPLSPGGTGDGIAPQLLGLAFDRSAFSAAPSGPSVRASARRRRVYGARVSYRLTESAVTTFTVQRARPGRRAGRRCVAPTRRNRAARRCTRFVRVRGSFRHSGRAGLNRFRFTGRIGGRRLAPGRYGLVARPRDAAGNLGSTARRPFRIIR